MNLLIKNAQIAQVDGTTLVADVLCSDGKIERIAANIDVAADETIDANGHLLLPGVIDPQVHFREPGNEHKEDLGSGSRAALRPAVESPVFWKCPTPTHPQPTRRRWTRN